MALAGLLDLEGYRVKDGSVDARGWPLFDFKGERVGTIEDLIVDTQALEARYVQVALQDLPRSVVLAVPELEIDPARQLVRVNKASKHQIEMLPYLGGEDEEVEETPGRRLVAGWSPEGAWEESEPALLLLRIDDEVQ